MRSIRTITQETERGARAQVRAGQQANREQASAARAAANEEKRQAKEVLAVVKQANREKAQAEKQAAREAMAAKRQQATEEKRHAREAVAVVKQANREKAADQRRQEREALASARKIAREQASADREATRMAQAARRAWLGGIGDGEKGSYSGAVARGLGKGVKAVAAPVLTAGVGLGAGAAVSAAEAQLALGQRAALVQNTTGLTGVNFVKMAKTVSSKYGVDAGEVMGGFEKISAKAGTGGFEAMGKNAEEMTQTMLELGAVARSAGVSMTDLGDSVGTMVNRGVRGKDLVEVVRGLVQQGKDGAVEYNQLATMLDQSSGALLRFKMSDKDRIITAGGLTQLGRTFGRKSAEEATQSVSALARDLGSHADVVQKLTGGALTRVHTKGKKTVKIVNGRPVETTVGDKTEDRWAGGVEVGTDTSRSQLRDINTLLPEIIMGAIKTGNVGKLTGAGGVFTDESAVLVSPLVQAAIQGVKKDGDKYRLVGDGEKADITGGDAIKTLLKQFEKAGSDASTTTKDLANVMKQDGAQLSLALNRLKNDLGDQLAPAISKLTAEAKNLGPALGKVSTALVGAVTTAIEYPLATAMGVIGASVGKSLLAQFLANRIAAMSVTAAVVNVTGGGGTPPGTPTGAWDKAKGFGGTAVGAAGAGAIAGTVAAGAVIGGTLGYVTAAASDEDLNRGRNQRGERAATATNLASKIRMGNASAEDIAQAKALTGQLSDDTKAGSFLSRFWKHSTSGVRELADGKVSAGNIASALPPLAALRGIYGGVLEGQEKGMDKNSDAALKELQAALDKPTTLAPGTTINIGNVGEVAAAVNKGGGRDPTAQPIAGQ